MYLSDQQGCREVGEALKNTGHLVAEATENYLQML
jgi:hypothetical protein